MGYETLESTKMLDTRCAICGRRLREVGSVTVSIGPDCRQKYGYDDVKVSDEARAEANALISQIADKRRGPTVIDAAQRLRVLGFDRVAEIIMLRLVPVRLERVGDRLHLFTKYDPLATERLRKVQGRWFNREQRRNEFPYSSKNDLWAALRELYAGEKMLGPDGNTIEIPALKSAPPVYGDVNY